MTKIPDNLKYSIGLDIGTGSVGHAALDSHYNLLKYKGRYAWGSRLFEGAQTAADTREKRGIRRGYRRRKNRIRLLQEVMAPTLVEYPEFFRVNTEVEKWTETNDFRYRTLSEVLFEIGGSDYYHMYPTIYHLRYALLNTTDSVDPRLVYLAIHNLIKFRGHFLYDTLDPGHGATNDEENREQLEQFIEQACELFGEEVLEYDIDRVWRILSDVKVKKAIRLEQLTEDFKKQFTNTFFKLLLGGYKVKIQSIFPDFEDKALTIDLSKEESEDVIEQLSDEQEAFIRLAQNLNSGIILKNLLLGSGTVAEAKVKKYEHFQKQLKEVKVLVKQFDKKVYREIFVSSKQAIRDYDRHHSIEGLCLFDKYRYQRKESLGAKEALYKRLKTVFDEMDESKMVLQYREQIVDGTLFERLNGVENRAIPMQCSSYEAVTILQNQNYPKEIIDKVKALIEFRIPYYVGPLVKKSETENRFSWSVRKKGMENTRITPWNFNQVIDKDESGSGFINRMRNKCTYLLEEDTLSKYSLLYQEYEVLNELNGVSWKIGEKKTREAKFTEDEKRWIIKEIFLKSKTVTVKRVCDELIRAPFYMQRRGSERTLTGTQKETAFASSLSSWIDFTTIFGEINDTNYDMIEEIILWLTLFTEKEIVERKIRNTYPLVTDVQVNKITKLISKYKGYGRLSRKLLDGIVDQTDYRKTIIEHLREKPDVFMRVLNDPDYDYKSAIEKEIQEVTDEKHHFSYKDDVAPIPGSPAIKRSIWQSLKIVDEYVRLFGIPERIVIEMPREDDIRNKKKRTKSREDQWETIKKELKGSSLLDEVKDKKYVSKNDIKQDERLWLYLNQGGKCMYSGEKLEISELYKYDVDHILPRRFIKDDSIDNKVLVLNEYNARKSGDKLPLDVANPNMISIWSNMRDKKLISAKKFNNLMRRNLSDEEKMGFIARQLVETRQVTKHVVRILENRFLDEKGNSKVVISTLKPDIVSKLKSDMGIIKIREAGDKHHAVDAFVCAWLDRFMDETYGRNIFAFEFGVDLKEEQKWFLSKVLYKSTKGEKTEGEDFFLFRDAKEWVHTNPKTGEVKAKAVPYFKQYVYNTPCQFTQRHIEAPAQFSKETINSPKVTLNGRLNGTPFLNSRKSDMGLYTSLEVAYMCIISYEKIVGKKVTKKTELVNVQVIEDAVYRKDKEALAHYLCDQQLSEKEREKGGYVKSCEIIRKIEKGQLLRSNGNHLFTIKSVKEMNNARHFRMTEEETRLCEMVLKQTQSNKVLNPEKVYDQFKAKVLMYYAEIISDKLAELINASELNEENIMSLLRIIKVGAANGKMFGSDRPTRYTKAPKLEETVLINQSITGLEVREEYMLKGE